MIAALQLEPRPLQRGRPPKSTPERIQQIRNLVERGKSRDEIAEIIGVTTGTLQVTCSKLGISLRRPTFDLGTGLLRPWYWFAATKATLPEVRILASIPRTAGQFRVPVREGTSAYPRATAKQASVG
jgi:hypothetical protein